MCGGYGSSAVARVIRFCKICKKHLTNNILYLILCKSKVYCIGLRAKTPPGTQEREVWMKKILFVASEAVPFIKTGGLADVVGSLPKCFDKRVLMM